MKTKSLGIKLGTALVIAGILLAVINHLLLKYWGVTVSLIIGYPVFICWGIAFLLFPGAKPDSLKTKNDIKSFLKKSTKTHKIAWLFSLLCGMAGTVALMLYYGVS